MRPAPRAAHVAAASLNQTVGDWFGNQRRIHAVITAARGRGARLLVLPEMAIPGYSLGDRLFMRGTLDRSWRSLMELLPSTHGIVVCIGLPVLHRGVLFNVVAVCADGRLLGLVPKENLATGDVQYENRWFSGWSHGDVEDFVAPDGSTCRIGTLLFDIDGLGGLAVEVCEDGWKGLRPGSVYALAGAHLVANPSARWFTLGKHARRRRMVEQISQEDYVTYLYTSLLGCDATRLVFDGSVFIAAGGEILSEGRRFRFGDEWELIDRVVDLGALERARMEEGSWRQQVEALHRGQWGRLPQVIEVRGVFSSDAPSPPSAPYWEVPPVQSSVDPSLDWLHATGLIAHAPTRADLPHLELELALCIGLRDYVQKSGIRGVSLALSGGRDSAMCAVLIDRMHRYNHPDLHGDARRAHLRAHFTTAYMGTENSGSATRTAARALAEEIGAEHFEGDIQAAVETHLDTIGAMTGLRPSWSEPSHDVPLQNVQARLRGSLIWMIANLRGHLLLTTSNKSEAAVGYTTMDGDTSGGLSPLADVPKSLIQLWLAWAARFHQYESLKHVLETPATAELRPPGETQTDEGDLMPFAVLDRLIYQFVQLGQEPLEMFRALWPEWSARYGGDPRGLAAHIRKFVRLFCFAQWKRERFAISFRVTAFDLDPKTGFRFPPVQAPFTEELSELDTWIDHLVDELGLEEA